MSQPVETTTGSVETTSPATSGDAGKTPRTRKRIRWIVAGASVVALLIYFIVPLVAAGYVAELGSAALADLCGGRCTIGDVSVSWGGHVTARDITVDEADGRPALRCKTLEANVAVFKALGGDFDIDGELSDVLIYVSRGEDGRAGLALLRELGAPKDSQSEPSGTEASPEKSSSESNLDLAVKVSMGRVVVLEDRERQFALINGSLLLRSAEPFVVDLSFRELDYAPAAAEATARAELHAEIAGGDRPRVLIRHDLKNLTLERWPGPIVELLGLDELRGTISGKGSTNWDPGSDAPLGVAGTGTLRADGLRVAGARLGERPLTVERLRVAFADAQPADEELVGSLEIDDFVTVRLHEAAAGSAELAIEADLARASAALGDALPFAMGGAVDSKVNVRNGIVRASLTAQGLQLIDDGPAAQLAPMNISLESEGSVDKVAGGSFTWSSGTLRGPGIELAIAGSIGAVFESPQVAVDLRGTVDPAAVGERLRPLLGDATLAGDAGELTIAVRSDSSQPPVSATISAPSLEWAAGEERIAQRDVQVTVTLPRHPVGDEAAPANAFHFAIPKLETRMVRGDLRGWLAGEQRALRGTVDYVPTELDAFLKPYLPESLEGYRLAGTEPERVALDLVSSGAFAPDLFALGRTLTGTVNLAVAEITRGESRAAGDVVLTFGDEHLRAAGEVALNGGTVDIDGDLHLSDASDAVSKVAVTGENVRATAEIAEMLRLVHPIFAVTEGTVDGLIDGAIGGDGNAEHRGPLSMELIAGGWEALPKEPIHGRGHLEVSDFTLRGTPLMDELLGILDRPQPKEIELNDVDFTVADGRVRYDRPMRMKVDGRDTAWTGTIGLDETLDLIWELPIDDAMKERYPELRYLGQESIRVPVGGTTSRPRVAWRKVLTDAAATAIEKGAERAIDDFLGKEAGEILAEADRLWDAGRLGKARKLYRALKENHDKSLVYILNKKRIRDRLRP